MALKQNLQDGIDEAARAADQTANVAKDAGQQALRQGQAALDDGKTAMAKAEGEGQRWMSWAMDSYQANLTAMKAMMAVRSPMDVINIQSELMRNQINLLINASGGVGAAMTRLR